jgi:uncharacterized glyoxalase superfamily protein PhnB
VKLQRITPLLNVADVDRTSQFYADAFGFEIIEQAGPSGSVVWARIACDGSVLMLNKHGEGSQRRLAERADHSDIVLYIGVEDAADLHARLAQAGMNPGELEKQEYGVMQFALYDPDGYELAITGPLFRTASAA